VIDPFKIQIRKVDHTYHLLYPLQRIHRMMKGLKQKKYKEKMFPYTCTSYIIILYENIRLSLFKVMCYISPRLSVSPYKN